jgi:hypothetical protein
MWLLKISLILVDSLLKVGPGKTKKILEKSWNFPTKKVYEPWFLFLERKQDSNCQKCYVFYIRNRHISVSSFVYKYDQWPHDSHMIGRAGVWQTCRYDGQIYFHWYKILDLLYKRVLFYLQFVHNLFWLKLKWNARSKLFLLYHLKKLVIFVHFKGFNISQKSKSSPLSYFA